MIPSPTPDQVEERLEILPEHLKRALFSMATTNVGREAARTHGLHEEDIPPLGEVISRVLMGFIHPSGAADAIKEHLNVDADKAREVASELNEKIFKSFAAEIEKIYVPLSGTSPKLVDIAATQSAAMRVPPVSTAPSPLSAQPMPPGNGPVRAPFREPPATAPTGTLPAVFSASTPTPPSIPKPEARPGGGATPPPTATMPAPFMLHQETAAAPLPVAAGFKLNVPADIFKAATPMKKADVPLPPRAAELEIGRTPIPPKPASGPVVTTPSGTRVVHYSDFRTAVPPIFPTADPKASTVAPAAKAAPAAPAPVFPSMHPPVTPANNPPAHLPPPTPIPPVRPSVVPPAPPITPPVVLITPPTPPAPPIPSAPSIPRPVPSSASPLPPAPNAAAPAPATSKPGARIVPKVVNFGPEEVK